jgi:PAT family beta-lactamase induction signal transducer AmpG
VSLESIGWLSALAAPWSLKVLWAPLVDRYGHRPRWIAGALFAAGLAMLGLATTGAQPGWLLVALLVGFTLAAATSDVAIDAFTIGALERDEEGPANGLRITAYRLALVAVGGGAVALAGPLGWEAALVVVALVLIGLALLAPFARRVSVAPSAASWRQLVRGMAAWFVRPGAVPLAAFILLYKWPDAALGPMVRTFWVDAGLSREAMGSLALPNILATVGGAWVGAVCVARFGMVRGLVICGVAQALSNLAYAAADVVGGDYATVFAAVVVESGCGGMGTTAFLALLMRVCEKERAASEYALLSALFALTRDLTGAFSGEGVAAFGYAGWFGLTTLLAVPGLALLRSPQLRWRIESVRRAES